MISAIDGGTLRFNGTVTSSGSVQVVNASLTATGTYTQTARQFSARRWNGAIEQRAQFPGRITRCARHDQRRDQNNAMLRPALGGTGLQVTGNVSLLSASQLVFQLGGLTQGSQYGFINVNGNVSLGGQLLVSFVNGFQSSVANGNTSP